ncbi:Uu.00g026020.m01.CDS01 [Anthostomella pinea]|uniref:Uu.00g026020.m01.CDS01 n=1 Tax=Anthostomella pinea TaxID=933095 RepID=A0AAI8V7B1_9PEZI|nr:Uu.00g026020.m01.CDS01 [Anthostomella pinea]
MGAVEYGSSYDGDYRTHPETNTRHETRHGQLNKYDPQPRTIRSQSGTFHTQRGKDHNRSFSKPVASTARPNSQNGRSSHFREPQHKKRKSHVQHDAGRETAQPGSSNTNNNKKQKSMSEAELIAYVEELLRHPNIRGVAGPNVTCGLCKVHGHGVLECVKVGPDGTTHACPYCNGASHIIDACELLRWARRHRKRRRDYRKDIHDKILTEYLIVHRQGLPAITSHTNLKELWDRLPTKPVLSGWPISRASSQSFLDDIQESMGKEIPAEVKLFPYENFQLVAPAAGMERLPTTNHANHANPGLEPTKNPAMFPDVSLKTGQGDTAPEQDDTRMEADSAGRARAPERKCVHCKNSTGIKQQSHIPDDCYLARCPLPGCRAKGKCAKHCPRCGYKTVMDPNHVNACPWDVELIHNDDTRKPTRPALRCHECDELRKEGNTFPEPPRYIFTKDLVAIRKKAQANKIRGHTKFERLQRKQTFDPDLVKDPYHCADLYTECRICWSKKYKGDYESQEFGAGIDDEDQPANVRLQALLAQC